MAIWRCVRKPYRLWGARAGAAVVWLVAAGLWSEHYEARWVVGCVVLGVAIEVSGALAQVQHENWSRDDRIKAHQDQVGRRLVDQLRAAQAADPEGTLRANIMLASDDRLTIAYATEGYTSAEIAAEWASGQGCCGQAFASGRTTTFQDPGGHHKSRSAALRRAGLKGDRAREVAHLSVVVAVPIHDPNHPRFVRAILCLDYQGQPDGKLAIVRGVAEGIAHRLERELADTDFRMPSEPPI